MIDYIYTDFFAEGLIFAFDQQVHHRINKKLAMATAKENWTLTNQYNSNKRAVIK